MKKKILITACSLEVGGIERSLVGLLDVLDYTRYDVDVLLFSRKGELLDTVSPHCTILPEIPRCATLLEPIRTVLLKGHVLLAAARLLTRRKVDRRFTESGADAKAADGLVFAQLQGYWDSSIRFLPKLKGEYDAAISFMWPHHFAAYKVRAKKRFAWIHTDYTIAILDKEKDEAVWRRFDRIAAVSDAVGDAFSQVYPALRDKIVTVENILPQSFVRKSATEYIPQDMPHHAGEYRLLTVGRYCYPKAFDRAVRVSRILKDRGVPFRWYVIGYGAQEAQLAEWIRQENVEDVFILLGKKTNPYPYMAQCDLYVQPSRYEGKAVTVREAQMLCRPILITDFQTARSQVTEGKDAVIAPQDETQLAEAIEALLLDENKRASFSAFMASHDYSNAEQVERIYQMIEG